MYLKLQLLNAWATIAVCLRYMPQQEIHNLPSMSFLKGFSHKEKVQIQSRHTPTGYGIDFLYRVNRKMPLTFTALFAPDATAYSTFQDVFSSYYTHNNRCNPYHQQLPDRHFGGFEPQDLQINAADAQILKRTVKSTRIRLARSLKGYPLRPTNTAQQLSQIQEKLLAAVNKLPQRFQGGYQRQAASSSDQDEMFKVVGYYEHWPVGQGTYTSKDNRFVVQVNEEDHYRISYVERGGDVVHAYSELLEIISVLDQELEFDYSQQIGYYNSNPLNTGTGMRVSFMVQLSNDNLQQVKKYASRKQLQLRGKNGYGTEAEDHYYQISNKDMVCSSVSSLIAAVSRRTAQIVRDDARKGKSDIVC